MPKLFLKYFTASVMTLMLTGLFAGAEVIDTDSPSPEGSVSVNYNGSFSYTVTIPASVTFTKDETEIERSLSASDVVLDEGMKLNVLVDSRNGFKMVNSKGYIEYKMSVNGHDYPASGGVPLLTVEAGNKSGWAILTFSTEFSGEFTGYTGNYSDTLTFTVQVE